MFDAETAALIRSAPSLQGVDPERLPQELTAIYAYLKSIPAPKAVKDIPLLDQLK